MIGLQDMYIPAIAKPCLQVLLLVWTKETDVKRSS